MFQLLDATLFDHLFAVFSELQAYLERGTKFPHNNWVDIMSTLENSLKDASTQSLGHWGKRDSWGESRWGKVCFSLSHESRIRAALKGSTRRYTRASVRGLRDFWSAGRVEFPSLYHRERHWAVKL